VSDFEGTAPHEAPYGLQRPANVYPLFENAIRAHRGRDLESHQRYVSELYSRFSAVAAQNPFAWFRRARTPKEIGTVSADNRYIGFPYTKYMNAIIEVDQSAAVLMTTVGTARRLGIDASRWVYLHGCANAQDHWFVSERENYHSSPAIRTIGRKALAMAGSTITRSITSICTVASRRRWR
jgi:acetyl-CoA C-acetyltransferase